MTLSEDSLYCKRDISISELPLSLQGQITTLAIPPPHRRAWDATAEWADDFPAYFQIQQRPDWCWIATSTSVVCYLLNNPRWITQSGLYAETTRVLGCDPAFAYQAKDGCSRRGFLPDALQTQGVFCATIEGEAFREVIAEYIAHGRPVIMGLRDRFGGHAITIYGALNLGNGNAAWLIADPMWGISQVPIGIFPRNYGGDTTALWEKTWLIGPPL